MTGLRSASTARALTRCGLAVCLATALLLAAASTATAKTTVTVSFSAVVEVVDDPSGTLCAQVLPGDVVTGTYTYTLGTSDSNDGDWVADYRYTAPPNGVTVEVAGETTGSDPDNTDFLVEIIDD